MKLIVILMATIFLLSSCFNMQNKKKYIGPSAEVMVTGNFNSQNSLEDGLFKFYNATGKVISTGNFSNGVRIDSWYYNIQDSLIQFRWMPFTDKKFEFITNVLSPVDTVFYGDYYTQFDYLINGSTLSLSISINSPFVSTIISNRYEESVKQELELLNYYVDTFVVTKLSGIKIYSYVAANRISGKKIFTKTAYGYIGKDFIQIIVNSTELLNRNYNEVLLEGVLTNLFYRGKRFYNPYSPSM